MAFSLLQHSPHAHAYGHGHEGLSSGTIPNLRYGSLQPTRRTVLPLYSRLDPLYQGLLRLPPPASSSSSSSLPSMPAEPAVAAASSNLADGIAPPQPSQLAALMASVVGCESDAPVSDGEETVFSLLPSPSPSPSPLLLAESMASAVQSEKKAAEAEALESSVSRRQKRDLQRSSYLFAAIASSTGVTSLSVAAVYYRFTWQMQGATVPVTEMFGTFALAFGAAVGMEYWARWAHKELWHNSLWSMHESHHRPREGPFELNDIFAIINAVPAIALIAYGFFHKGLVPGLCFGAGLGITVFGMAYMFVHDGLIHRRFPVGPIADVPFFQRVAVAHQLHHADKYQGVPFGIFLGPQELENVGGSEELEKLLEMRKRGIQATKEKSES